MEGQADKVVAWREAGGWRGKRRADEDELMDIDEEDEEPMLPPKSASTVGCTT
jgi:hypothetical protein